MPDYDDDYQNRYYREDMFDVNKFFDDPTEDWYDEDTDPIYPLDDDYVDFDE